MSTELSRKDEVAKVTERAKPTRVTIGNKQVISSGKWNNDLVADYVLERGRDKWIKVGDLAGFAYSASIPTNKARVRKSLAGLFRHLLLYRGVLLVIEYDQDTQRAKHVKIFDGGSNLDLQNMEQRLERMKKRRELTALQFDTATQLLMGMARQCGDTA